MRQTTISVEHMHTAAMLYRRARAVLYSNTEEERKTALDDLENAVYQYEESLQWETVKMHTDYKKRPKRNYWGKIE
jgi:hypothetical protein